MRECPRCKSPDIHRSRSRSKWEAWRKEITGKRLYRCAACGWRGWGIDRGPHFGDAQRQTAERAVAPEPPNLQEMALAREERWVSEFNPKALDEVAPTTEEGE